MAYVEDRMEVKEPVAVLELSYEVYIDMPSEPQTTSMYTIATACVIQYNRDCKAIYKVTLRISGTESRFPSCCHYHDGKQSIVNTTKNTVEWALKCGGRCTRQRGELSVAAPQKKSKKIVHDRRDIHVLRTIGR